MPSTSRSRSPLKFFLMVIALSLPFWLAGALTTISSAPEHHGLIVCPDALDGGAGSIPQFTAPAALVLALAFFVAALGEELGWSGYVIDPMQKRWGALRAGIIWGQCGPRGNSCPSCRHIDRRLGSPGDLSPRWRCGFFSSGFITIRARACSLRLFATPWQT